MKKKELFELISSQPGTVKSDSFYDHNLKAKNTLYSSRFNKASIDCTTDSRSRVDVYKIPSSRDKKEQVLFDRMKSIMGELRSTTPNADRTEKNKVQLMKMRVEKVLQSNSPLRTRINPVN